MNTEKYTVEKSVDRVLSSYFKAELPDPFPPFAMPGRTEFVMPVRVVNRSRLLKTHLSLAASVALLVGGCWYLSGQMTEPAAKTNSGKGGSAHVPSHLTVKEDAKKAHTP